VKLQQEIQVTLDHRLRLVKGGPCMDARQIFSEHGDRGSGCVTKRDGEQGRIRTPTYSVNRGRVASALLFDIAVEGGYL
jgi:hypothetical protein